jgi:hypothetical protein
MTINDQSSRGAAATSADEIGKVFILVDQDAQMSYLRTAIHSASRI